MYLQTDPRWADLTYDGVNKFKYFGCFVVSLANLCDKLPTEVARILRDNKIFTNGFINDSEKAAQVLGLEYHGRSSTKPNYDCIAETNYFDKASTSQLEQHFFVVKADGSQIDPLGKNIKYPIISCRLFRKETMSTIIWQDQDIRFNPEQAKRLYQIIGRREPENSQVTQNRGWDIVEGLNKELEAQIKGRDFTIADQKTQITTIKAQLYEKIVQLATANKTIAEKEKTNVGLLKELEALNKENDELMAIKPLTEDEKLYIRIGKKIKTLALQVYSWITRKE